MKKIISIALCLGLVVISLAACSSRKYVPKEKKKNNNAASTYEEKVYPVPEEQSMYSVKLEYIDGKDVIEIVGYTGEEAELVIPDTLYHESSPSPFPVCAIGDAAFLGNEKLTSVTIPEGVVKLGVGAFQNCTNLTTVTLPETLKTIDDNCFHNSGLTTMNVPAGLSKVGTYAFSTGMIETPWYASLTDEKVIIGDGILLKYNGTGSVDFGEEVKSVAYYAFKNTDEIEVTLGNAFTDIDEFAVFNPSKDYSNIVFKYPAENEDAAYAFEETDYTYQAIQPESEEDTAAEDEADAGEEAVEEVTEEAAEAEVEAEEAAAEE